MGRRSEKESDNLWLLLDTICNAFGGMVMIALVYALHANEVRITKPTQELLDTVKNASNAFLNVSGQHAKLTNDLGRVRGKTNLWVRIQQLSNDCSNLSVTVSNFTIQVTSNHWFLNHPDAATSNTVAILGNLTAQLARSSNTLNHVVQTHIELTNALRAAQTLTLTNELRFPKEHDANKIPLHLILRYNSIYFTRDPSRKQGGVNTDGLRWTLGDNDTLLVAAVRGRGIDPTDQGVLARFNALDANRTYLVCWVYEDSFSTFNTLKDFMQQAKLEYGWMPVESEEAIKVSAEPMRQPPPQ